MIVFCLKASTGGEVDVCQCTRQGRNGSVCRRRGRACAGTCSHVLGRPECQWFGWGEPSPMARRISRHGMGQAEAIAERQRDTTSPGSDLLEGWFRRPKPTACLPRGLKTKGCAMSRAGCNASGAWLVEVDSRGIGPPSPPPKARVPQLDGCSLTAALPRLSHLRRHGHQVLGLLVGRRRRSLDLVRSPPGRDR